MTRVVAAAAIAGMTALLWPASAAAHPALCGPRADVVERLRANHDEVPVSVGLAGGGGLLEVFASERGTFTIVVTTAGGVSCLVASGRNWERIVPPPKGEKT